MKVTTNTHGGSRKNAGRKPKDPSGPVVRVTTWITAKQAKYFAENPRLNRTAEIQAALDAWISGVETSSFQYGAELARDILIEEIERRKQLIISEPNGIVRETMIDNLLIGVCLLKQDCETCEP